MTVDCSADTKANGGAGSLAEQLADSPYDIILGGGLVQLAFQIITDGRKADKHTDTPADSDQCQDSSHRS